MRGEDGAHHENLQHTGELVLPAPEFLGEVDTVEAPQGCLSVTDGVLSLVLQQSRWNLLCVLCKERVGSCIQCSVKTCKTAYHVTCAFKRGLEMRAIIEDENAEDGVKLRVSNVLA